MRVCYMALSLGSTEPQGRPIAITPLCSKKELAAAAARQGTGDLFNHFRNAFAAVLSYA